MAKAEHLWGGRWGGGWMHQVLPGDPWPVIEKSRCLAHRYLHSATARNSSGIKIEVLLSYDFARAVARTNSSETTDCETCPRLSHHNIIQFQKFS
jgi:hypothetical protein